MSGRLADKRTEGGGSSPRRPREQSRLGLVPPARSGGRTSAVPRDKDAAATRPRVARAPRPRFRLTRRATVLALALCAVVVAIAYPLQEYLSESSQLNAVNQQNAALTRQVAGLQRQVGLWSDPGYVRIQARSELHYVAPGEEGFTIPGPANGTEPLGLPTPAPSPWYDKLWDSVTSSPALPNGG